MHRAGLAVWAIWLALTPLGLAWAYGCACSGQLTLQCCGVQPAVRKACCTVPASAACCAAHDAPCADCSGCRLERVKPQPAVAAWRIAFDWADWVLDAPELTVPELLPPARDGFRLPSVRNHSPPLSPCAPRAPPLS
ncbi:MAG: hypothetical protein NZ843_02195 [Fimbriimonadales bacterium]|nr:hypothetical protein [Fimbriimonadales bacterium]